MWESQWTNRSQEGIGPESDYAGEFISFFFGMGSGWRIPMAWSVGGGDWKQQQTEYEYHLGNIHCWIYPHQGWEETHDDLLVMMIKENTHVCISIYLSFNMGSLYLYLFHEDVVLKDKLLWALEAPSRGVLRFFFTIYLCVLVNSTIKCVASAPMCGEESFWNTTWLYSESTE